MKKINKETIVGFCIILLIIVIVLMLLLYKKHPQGVNNIKYYQSSSSVKNSELEEYFTVQGKVEVKDGKYYYNIMLAPKSEKYSIDVYSIFLTLQFYGATEKSKRWLVKIDIKDFEQDENGIVHMKGVYEDVRWKFTAVDMQDDFSKYIILHKLNAQIWENYVIK